MHLSKDSRFGDEGEKDFRISHRIQICQRGKGWSCKTDGVRLTFLGFNLIMGERDDKKKDGFAACVP